jgi:fatty acid desaturase
MQWRDLLQRGRFEVAAELLLPLPFLIASWGLFLSPWPWLGVLPGLWGFLAVLRVSHGAMHGSLGLRNHDWVLVVASVLLLGPHHGYQANHLRHHAGFDGEARSAHWPLWKALVAAPAYPFYLAVLGWRQSNRRQRRFIVAEHGLLAAALGAVALWPWLAWHLAVVVAGQLGFPVYAAWLVHRGDQTRSHRGRLAGVLSLNLTYHAEHHRHPMVPTARLPELARRMDAAGLHPAPIVTPQIERWPRLRPMRARYCPSYRRALRQSGIAPSGFGRPLASTVLPPARGARASRQVPSAREPSLQH